MQIKIVWPWELPDYIDGVAVVCDVWAATTNINTLLTKGISKLFLVNMDNVEKAKKEYTNSLVVGQSLKLPKTFFNTSNYPYDVAKIEAKSKIILYMTNNGTRIIELTFEKKAHKVLTVSFSNIKNIARCLKNSNEKIYLIPAGEVEAVDHKVLEDLICIQSLEKLLKGRVVDLDKAKEIAKDFVKKMYGYQDFNQSTNFKVVFNQTDLKVVPICKKDKNGWISVKDAKNYGVVRI